MVHAHYTAIDQAKNYQALSFLVSTHLPQFFQRASLGIAVSLVLSGCVVGPDFKSPAAPQLADHRYNAAVLPTTTVLHSIRCMDRHSQHNGGLCFTRHHSIN
jgi:hypothetical protein